MFSGSSAASEIPIGRLREIRFAHAVTFFKYPNCSHEYNQTANIGKIFISHKLVPEGIHNIGQHKIILLPL